ncbi:hypothetical protein ABPG72_021089 [Tetrahymena utriculariae]
MHSLKVCSSKFTQKPFCYGEILKDKNDCKANLIKKYGSNMEEQDYVYLLGLLEGEYNLIRYPQSQILSLYLFLKIRSSQNKYAFQIDRNQNFKLSQWQVKYLQQQVSYEK